MSALPPNVLQNSAAFCGSTGFKHCLSLSCSPLVGLTALSTDKLGRPRRHTGLPPMAVGGRGT
jgi:hypothetical protein